MHLKYVGLKHLLHKHCTILKKKQKKRKSMGTVCLKALWEHINSNAQSIV